MIVIVSLMEALKIEKKKLIFRPFFAAAKTDA